VKKYSSAFAAWKTWCTENQVAAFHPSHKEIARYFICLYNSKAPYSRIETVFYALKWKFDCQPDTSTCNPCNVKFLHLILDGLKRTLAKPTVRKEPVTAGMLAQYVSIMNCDCLKDLRIAAMMLLGYAGFLRYDELSSLKICDVVWCHSHIKLFIERSKTDQFREGAWVVIAPTGRPTCPVNMLHQYLKCAGISDLQSNDFLFRPITYLKSSGLFTLRKGKVSYSRCREIFKEALESIGIDSSKFGLHSLRSGGASAAAERGVPDRLLLRQGRWKSETSKNMYVKESLSNKLVVSLNVGL
jgi:integrase